MKIEKYPLIEVNEDEILLTKSHVFFFKNATEILVVTRGEKDLKSLPNSTVLKRWIENNFNVFSHFIEEGKGRKFQRAEEVNFLDDLILEIMVENQYTFLHFNRNPFIDEPFISRQDHILKYTAPRIYFSNYEVLEYALSDEMINEVVADYLIHFPQFSELLQWVVACRFTEQRRNSYAYLRVNAGFGKSLFSSIFEGLGIGKKIKQSQMKDSSASDLSPANFRNTFAMLIDEFTHFSQEMKDITNYMSLSAKFQLSEVVPLYAKIFMSAEKSSSFYGDAGVDAQIADRVNVMDFAEHTSKIEDREVYKRVGNAIYADSLRVYTLRVIKEEVARYVAMGRVEADKEAIRVLQEHHSKYRVHSTTIEKIKEKVHGFLVDFVEWEKEGEAKSRNTFFEQLGNFVFIKNEDEVVIKDVVKMYEIMLKNAGEQFAKVAKFKQTSLDEVLVAPLDKHQIRCGNKNVYGVLVNLPRLVIKKDVTPVEIKDKNGFSHTAGYFDGEKILGKNGEELF